ncbi:MAG: Gfo/Idh/MocA family oxidoreductase [Gemmataceae bacterium]|nr:Gfo/Idh/MocA family oxidoreductase [Gemmataceae bacterium]
MKRLRVGVIGVGHLGQAHARILAGLPDVELVGVADANPNQARMVAERHDCRMFTHYGPLLDLVDAACVVVNTTHHHTVSRPFLDRGIHLLIEKPITVTVEQADDLIAAARKSGAVLQVGHIERFNPAFEELCSRPIRPKFVECERHGPFTGRSMDIGAVLDLMIHDIDLLHALDGSPAVSVEAMGVAVFGQHEDMVNARIRFESGCVATVTASRIAAMPKRRLRIWAPEGYAGVDFVHRKLSLVQPCDELRRNGIDARNLDPAKRAQLQSEVFGRHLEMDHMTCNAPADQLTRELQDFVRAASTGGRPRVSGEDGRNALALATRVLDSVRRHQWDGRADGAIGMTMPAASGRLFGMPQRAAA